MEEYSKLWENEVFMTWKAGSPWVNVGLAMNFVCTCRSGVQRPENDNRHFQCDNHPLPGSPGG